MPPSLFYLNDKEVPTHCCKQRAKELFVALFFLLSVLTHYTIQIEFEENASLKEYVKRLRKALLDEEISFDRKKFMPHVTLIRRADCTKGKAFLPEFQENDAMRVNGISLMKSEQGRHGMVYTEIGYVRAL